MLFDEGDDKMIKTESFPTIRMKIDRLLEITNEYRFNDLVKAIYCINLCVNNRSVLESCLALNACLIEYEEKGSKRIGTYDEFKGFFDKIYDVMKPGIADDYTVEDFGEVRLRYNDKFYGVIIGTGHNNVYACLNFLPTLARKISREEELCLALEYVSGTIDYFVEENKNASISVVSEEMDVSVQQLNQWVREERLIFAEGSAVMIDCESCGAPIRTGRYCENCKSQMVNKFGGMYKKEEVQQKRDPRERARMRFLDN